MKYTASGGTRELNERVLVSIFSYGEKIPAIVREIRKGDQPGRYYFKCQIVPGTSIPELVGQHLDDHNMAWFNDLEVTSAPIHY